MTLRKTVVLLLALVLLPGVARAEKTVPTELLRQHFFPTLTKSQVVKFMTASDRAKQLTSYELGAKYRWGYIPPDRTPPVALAQWWSSLSPRKKNQERYQWFKKHNNQLNPDRVARQLDLQNQLTTIYRELRANYNKTPEALESVPFPSSEGGLMKANRSDTGFQMIYEQASDTGAPPQSVDQRPEYLPDVDEQRAEPSDEAGEASPEDETNAGDRASEPSRSKSTEEPARAEKKDHFVRGNLIYRRIDGDLEVVGRVQEGSGTSGEVQNQGDTATQTDGLSEAVLDLLKKKETGSDTVVLPLPGLRSSPGDQPSRESPQLRR